MDGHWFAGKRVLVTGGTRGFGRGFAEEFLARGGDVTITGTRPDSAGVDGCGFRAVDFSDDAQTADFAAWVRDQRFDVVVNNAGVNVPQNFEELDPAVFLRTQRINVHAPMHICRAAIPHMKSNGWGRIVNVSSICSLRGGAGLVSYSTSKFGIDGMTVCLAAHVAQYGILANCVAPGVFDTDMTAELTDADSLRRYCEKNPMHRIGKVPELAKFVVWLASEENTYINAQNIAVDGGHTRV